MIILQLANYVKRLIKNFAREIKAAKNNVDEMSYSNEILTNKIKWHLGWKPLIFSNLSQWGADKYGRKLAFDFCMIARKQEKREKNNISDVPH